MALTIPRDATFRRAEGLTFELQPCLGLTSAQVIAPRQGGATKATLSMDEVRLLSRLSRWSSADEVGAPHETLVWLVERNCAFWSRSRPDRDLTGAPLDALEGSVALRDNVFPLPLVSTGAGQVGAIAPMPRRGSLDRATLGGALFITVEMDAAVKNVTFRCCARHAEILRDLVVALDGTQTVSELSRDPEAGALLAALDHLALLERHTPPPRWDGAAQLRWLGHAAVLYEASGKRVLIDPVAYHRSDPHRGGDRPMDLRDLGPVDVVLITHGDNDHFHPGALYRIARKTPVVVPKVTEPRPYQIDMPRVLSILGFERVIEVDVWQRLTFGDVTVVAAPFRGEDWGLDLPCRTYVVAGPELTIYANADSTSTPEAYDRIASEFRIDVALLGVTGSAESHAMPPGFGYGNFYVKWIPPEKHNEWIELCNGPRESAAAAQRLEARYAFGYAAGGASFCNLQYTDRGTHADLARLLADATSAVLPLELAVGVPVRIPRRG